MTIMNYSFRSEVINDLAGRVQTALKLWNDMNLFVNMKKRLIWVAIFILIAFLGNLHAQGDAGQAGEFLRWGVGSKALGLGRAFTSVADDASALFWNPAGLSSLSKVGGTFMFMHVPLREGASFNYFGGAVPLRLFFINKRNANSFIRFIQELKLGVGWLWLSLGKFDNYDAVGNPMPEQSQNTIGQSAMYFSASYPLNGLFKRLVSGDASPWIKYLKGNMDIGITTKFIHQDLFGINGSATGLDLGIKYTHHSGLFNFGFILRDFNRANISYGNNVVDDKIPSTATLGVSLVPPFSWLRGLLLSFDYGVITPSEREHEKMFGLEFDLSVINSDLPIKLRFGSNSVHESFTFGINISPELALGNDWIPYGDWTYANDKAAFDAVGSRFSFSVDRNPFTAKYWYLNGMVLLQGYGCSNLTQITDNDKIIRYFRNAEEAKNPGKHAYRYEAALRRADIAFLTSLSRLSNTNPSNSKDKQKALLRIAKISRLYSERASKFIREDYGKNVIDTNDYFNSFLYYVQSLIISGNESEAIRVCAERGKTWGKNRNVIKDENGSMINEREELLNYLHAYSLFKSGSRAGAVELIKDKLSNNSLAKCLLGHILFLEGNYTEALSNLNEIDLNDAQFPKNVFLPLTYDCTFGDEILFLKTASMFMNPKKVELSEIINEFAKIPRYFPNSDLGRFITHHKDILSTILENFEKKNMDEINRLFIKIINSYIKSFSSGTLNEIQYAYNYKLISHR
ncbi:MAG: hypothetical protein ACE5IW_02995 [bacterium]